MAASRVASHTAARHFSAAPHRSPWQGLPAHRMPGPRDQPRPRPVHLLEQRPSYRAGSGDSSPVGHRPLIPAGPRSAHPPWSRAGSASTPREVPPFPDERLHHHRRTGGWGRGADERVTSKPQSCEAWSHGNSRCQRRHTQCGVALRVPGGPGLQSHGSGVALLLAGLGGTRGPLLV